MKILLLSPPVGSLTNPALALPSLTGYLRSIGHEVIQHDVGIATIDILLSRDRLATLYTKAGKGLEKTAHDAHDRKTREEQNVRIGLFAGDVIEKIEWAKQVMRSKELFYRPLEYSHAAQIIRRAFEIISAAFYPTTLQVCGLKYRNSFTLEFIQTTVMDEQQNPFLAVIRENILPGLMQECPDIVGISATFSSQIHAAYTVAQLIKDMRPETKVIMGGAAIAVTEDKIREEKTAHQWVDAYVFGEGEIPLQQFIEIIGKESCGKNHSPRLYLAPGNDSGREARNTEEPSRGRVEDIVDFDAIPTPDYTGLNLRDYFSPEITFLVSNHRGCYHRKCAFCAVSLSFMKGFRSRSAAKVLADIRKLREEHDARFFFFADDATTPKRCREIAAWSQGSRTPFYWMTEVRYEKNFSAEVLRDLYKGGCLSLIFGNESGNQRILDLMNKKTELRENIRIIHDASRAGISLNLQNFIGFPGETREEADDTINMLVSHRDHISSCSLSEFQLQKHSPVFQNPSAFGVDTIQQCNPDSLVPRYLFSCRDGIGREELPALVDAAKTRLSKHYPLQGTFLGMPGSHQLLYHKYFGERKFEISIAPGYNPRAVNGNQLRLSKTVRIARYNDDKAFLYAEHNGNVSTIPKNHVGILSLLQKTTTMNEVVLHLKRHDSPQSGEKGLQTAVDAMDLLMTLHRQGFLDSVATP
jgi:hypothetical protein